LVLEGIEHFCLLLLTILCRDHVEQGLYFITKDPRFPKLSKPNTNLPSKEYTEVLSNTLDWLCLHIREGKQLGYRMQYLLFFAADLPRGFAPLNRIETLHFATPSRPTYAKTKADTQQIPNNELDEITENLSIVQSYFLIRMSNYGFTR
jgi:hypothetical protein